jgi:hypothetical protein
MSDYISILKLNITSPIPYSPLNSSLPSAQMAPWVTEKFLAILSNLEESYKQSKRSQRKEVVKQGVLEITASAGKDGVAIPPNLNKVCSQLHSHFIIDAHSLEESTCLVPELSAEEKGSNHQEKVQ